MEKPDLNPGISNYIWWFSRGVLTKDWVVVIYPVNVAILKTSVHSSGICVALNPTSVVSNQVHVGISKGDAWSLPQPLQFHLFGVWPRHSDLKSTPMNLMYHRLGNHSLGRFSHCSREMRQTTHSWWESAWAITQRASLPTCYRSASCLSHMSYFKRLCLFFKNYIS